MQRHCVCRAFISAWCLAACVVPVSRTIAADPTPSFQAPEKAEVERDEALPELRVQMLNKGNSSRAMLREALSELPLKQLEIEQIDRVNEILENRSMFRRLPSISIDAGTDVYSYFTTNPEAAVGIWRVLEISKFKLNQKAPSVWFGDAGDGSKGTIEILQRSPKHMLLLCEGEYKSPLLLKPIHARALMHLRTNARPDGDEPGIVHDVDLFVTFPSQTIDTIARVISPISHMIADRNFQELSLFVRFMQVAMERQPGWTERTIQRINGITRQQREELMKLSAGVFVAARKRQLKQNGVTQAGLEEIVEPFRPTTPNGTAQVAEK